MAKILVSGSNGQLGTELKNLSKEYDMFDFCFTDVEELDITNAEDVTNFITDYSPDYIINAAAYTAVDRAESEEDNAYKINTIATQNLADAAEKVSAKLVHVSTDYVFDGKSHIPYSEEFETNPQSIYGKSKLEGEKAALKYADSIVIRTSWLYSAHGNNFVKTILKLSRDRDELKVIFDQVGTPTFAGDLAKAIMQMVTSIEESNFKPGVYHFSNEGVCSWYDFAQAIVKISNNSCNILPIQSSEFKQDAPRPFYSVLNKHKIKSNYNVTIPYWYDSLVKVVNELLGNNK